MMSGFNEEVTAKMSVVVVVTVVAFIENEL